VAAPSHCIWSACHVTAAAPDGRGEQGTIRPFGWAQALGRHTLCPGGSNEAAGVVSVVLLAYAAIGRTTAPVFIIHPANDYSVAPAEALAPEMKRLGKPYRFKIYPPFGRAADDRHGFVHLGVATWEPDVFVFLKGSMQR
jgi:hypothetical protein